MDRKIAILFMPDDIACAKEKTPLMLQSVLFCPILTWMCMELTDLGVERFFIVSDVKAHDLMPPCIPKDTDVTFVDGAHHARELLPLLPEDSGKVIIVNGVVLPLGGVSCGAEPRTD